EDPALMLIADLRPADLSFRELERVIAHLGQEDSPRLAAYVVRRWALLADIAVPLIILLLAVPFATTGVRVNPAVGVSKSLGLFALYFLLAKTSYAFGAADSIPPFWAALLPDCAMLILGGLLFARAR